MIIQSVLCNNEILNEQDQKTIFKIHNNFVKNSSVTHKKIQEFLYKNLSFITYDFGRVNTDILKKYYIFNKITNVNLLLLRITED